MVRKRPVKTAVVVFAREPVPGRVKTRLAAAIGEAAACSVYAALLERTLAVAAEAGFDLVVSFAEPPSPGWTAGHAQRWEVQREDDLGARMRDAFDRRFGAGSDRVVIVGSDCPLLRREHLTGAGKALRDAAVVLGPAADGGYWLVAQRRPGVDLFTGIPWSSCLTLAATRQRLESLGAAWVEIDALDDIDTEGDLRAALAEEKIPKELRQRLEDALRG